MGHGLFAAALASAFLLTSCSILRLNAVVAEERQVTTLTDASKTVTLAEPIVWLDEPAHRASKGVRLPMGLYTLEAEDAEYLYFKAPAPIEMRILEGGRPVEGPDIPGGLALAKGLFPALSPVTYVDVSPNRKMHVMKLGSDFLRMRGKEWDQSF